MRNFVVVIALLAFASVGRGDDAECKATIDVVIKRQIESFKYCLTTMEFKSKEERAEKMMCIMKCSMMKEGFLSEDGTINIAGSTKILNEFSTEVQTKIVDYLMATCQQYAHDIDTKDETCKTYEPIIKCGHAMINKVCKY